MESDVHCCILPIGHSALILCSVHVVLYIPERVEVILASMLNPPARATLACNGVIDVAANIVLEDRKTSDTYLMAYPGQALALRRLLTDTSNRIFVWLRLDTHLFARIDDGIKLSPLPGLCGKCMRINHVLIQDFVSRAVLKVRLRE